MNEYDYSSTGFALTRSFEGLRLEAYQDSAGIWTIGYGHTGPEVHCGQCDQRDRGRGAAAFRFDLCGASGAEVCSGRSGTASVRCAGRLLLQHRSWKLSQVPACCDTSTQVSSTAPRCSSGCGFTRAARCSGPGAGGARRRLHCFQGRDFHRREFNFGSCESTPFHRGGSGRTRIGTGSDRKGTIA